MTKSVIMKSFGELYFKKVAGSFCNTRAAIRETVLSGNTYDTSTGTFDSGVRENG